MAGGVAGALSRASAAPFERLRTMMMADQSNKRVWGVHMLFSNCVGCHGDCFSMHVVGRLKA